MILRVGIAGTVLLLLRRRLRSGSRAKGEDDHGAFIEICAIPAADDAPTEPGDEPEDDGRNNIRGRRYCVKDIFDIEGRVTGFGSPSWKSSHEPAVKTAQAVVKLQQAGAVGVGITHMDELAFSINGENVHYGTPKNPSAPDCIPGGSSSGSAVAVAAVLKDVDFALGTRRR